MPEAGAVAVVVVGGVRGADVGGSLHRGAATLGLGSEIVDAAAAYRAPAPVRWLNWRLRGKRPSRLTEFGDAVVEVCTQLRPGTLVCTGIAPLARSALDAIGRLGIRRLNFLTDDPWNPAHRAPWFLQAVPAYDAVFSPRRAVLGELTAAGCREVRFLPFGYDPKLFFPASLDERSAQGLSMPDVVFAGGADADRVPYMAALAVAGFKLALYGGYWDRYPQTRGLARGLVDTAGVRMAIATAKVAICLVRRANRDGNCMRTFEVPAIGTCMLTEDTPEHREIFGAEGQAVLYFSTVAEMVGKCRMLCEDAALRQRLAASAHRLISAGGHTYADRLESMLVGKGRG